MADSSRSSSSKRVQDFLPSFQPSYVSLISLFLCGILWLKNEATNERLSMLETTSPREISLRSGFPNWYFSEKSFRSTEEPRGSSLERTFAQDGSKRFHYSSGNYVLLTLQCKFLVEGLRSFYVCSLCTTHRTTKAMFNLNYPNPDGKAMNNLDILIQNCSRGKKELGCYIRIEMKQQKSMWISLLTARSSVSLFI